MEKPGSSSLLPEWGARPGVRAPRRPQMSEGGGGGKAVGGANILG